MVYYSTCRRHGHLGGPFLDISEAEQVCLDHLNAYSFPHGAEVLILGGKGVEESTPFEQVVILKNLNDQAIDDK